jgi:hypothetical protein
MTPPNNNINIIWDYRYTDAALLTGSGAQDGYPLANLQDDDRQRPWRSPNLTDQYVTWNMQTPVYCTCLALVQHNFTVNAQVRVQASESADFAVLLKDDLYDACEDMIGFGEGGFGAHGAGGAILYAERSFYAPRTLRIIYFEPDPGEDHIRARYWRLQFIDPDNPTGFFDIGRAVLCCYDNYLCQFEFDWAYGGQDESVIDKSVGNKTWIDAREVEPTLRLPWNTFPAEDVYWRFRFYAQKVGLSQPHIIDPAPAGRTSERYFLAKYCRLQEIPEMTCFAPGLHSVELAVIEEV